MKSTRTLFAVTVLAAPLLGTACKKEAPPPPPETMAPPPPPPPQPAVTQIELGSSVGADKRVLAARSSFGVKDSIIASVYTENTAPERGTDGEVDVPDGPDGRFHQPDRGGVAGRDRVPHREEERLAGGPVHGRDLARRRTGRIAGVRRSEVGRGGGYGG